MTLLPLNASSIEKALDALAKLKLNMDLTLIDNNPHTCPKQLLPWLANMWRVDITGLAEHEQRTLIANAFEIHRYKGTVYAVQKSLDSVFDDATLIENKAAYLFDAQVAIQADVNGVYGNEKFATARNLVNKAKNARSRFVDFIIAMPTAVGNIGKVDAAVFKLNLSSHLMLQATAHVAVQGVATWNL